MKIGDLKKGEKFTVNNSKLVLTVIFPVQTPGYQSVRLCDMDGRMTGLGVVAGRGKVTDPPFLEDNYVFPVTTEVKRK